MAFDPYSVSALDRDDTDAGRLSVEKAQTLVNWCDCQSSHLWDGLGLADILKIYHASIDWITFEAWVEKEGDAARKAWNAVMPDEHQLELGHA